jgi:uncharacterized protein (DUF934 family)
MRVIEKRRIVDDGWELSPGGGPLPPEGDLIVPLAVWNEHQQGGGPRAGRLAVVLQSDERPEQIEALDRAPLVAIAFPKFADGRGYSSARLLRDRLKYTGDLRAVGNVLRDQLFYMMRCGFSSFALEPGKDAEGALAAFDDFSIAYQAAADDPRPLFRRVTR